MRDSRRCARARVSRSVSRVASSSTLQPVERLPMSETTKRRSSEAAAAAAGGPAKKVKGAGPGGLGVTPATEGIHGCAALPGDVLMPWVGLGTYKVCVHCTAPPADAALLSQRTHDTYTVALPHSSKIRRMRSGPSDTRLNLVTVPSTPHSSTTTRRRRGQWARKLTEPWPFCLCSATCDI